VAGGSTAVAVTATSLPFASAVPGQSWWRPEGRRDLRRLAAASASTPTKPDPMASDSATAPHEGTSPDPSCLTPDPFFQIIFTIPNTDPDLIHALEDP